MAEMIGAELQLETVGGDSLWRHRDTCIVYQQVDMWMRIFQCGSRRAHRLKRRQIEWVNVHVGVRDASSDALGCLLAAADVADHQHHARSLVAQRSGNFEPDTA